MIMHVLCLEIHIHFWLVVIIPYVKYIETGIASSHVSAVEHREILNS